MDTISEEKALQQIATLTKREKVMLGYMCRGMSYKEMKLDDGASINTIKTHIKHVYKKLGMNKFQTTTKRRNILQVYYCPYLERTDVESAPEPSPESKSIIFVSKVDEVEIEKMIEEDDGEIYPLEKVDLPENPYQKPDKYYPPPRGGFPSWARILILILLGIGIGEVLSPILNSEPEIIYITADPEVSIDENQITVISPETQDSVSSTLDTTDASGIVGTQFFDDFEFGIDSLWSIQYGELGSSQGSFTVISPFESGAGLSHFAILETNELKNYNATLALSEYHATSYDSKFGMILRYSPKGESIGILFDPRRNNVSLGYFDNIQSWSTFPGTTVTENFDKTTIFRVEVDGNLYKVFANSDLITYATMPGVESGKLALWFVSSSKTDIEYYAPRVEYLRIDELE